MARASADRCKWVSLISASASSAAFLEKDDAAADAAELREGNDGIQSIEGIAKIGVETIFFTLFLMHS